jgi:hypothetical protein
MRGRARHREHPVEMILEAMTREGWQILRSLPTRYGAVACLLTGPGGAFAVEARTQPGRARLATVPSAWLRQASAQAETAERWLGSSVAPLLVLRHAELDHSGGDRDGVTVVAANDLPRFLRSSARSSVAA